MPFDSVEAAIEDIRAGKMVIVADDEDRENEGDLVCVAAKITPETVNFMATHGRGLICVALTPERADALGQARVVRVQHADPRVGGQGGPHEHRLRGLLTRVLRPGPDGVGKAVWFRRSPGGRRTPPGDHRLTIRSAPGATG